MSPDQAAESRMKIVHYPHPALRHPGKAVTSVDKQLRVQIGNMMELMYEARGLGLAAPQVALPFQLLVMNVTGDPKQPEREEVFLNPVIVERKGSIDDEEGCLSFPGLYQKMKVVSDLEARAWQHEIDHLNGVLFIDKMGIIARLSARSSVKSFENEFRRAQERGEIPPDLEIEKVLASLEGRP
jgi:peptide deformylase